MLLLSLLLLPLVGAMIITALPGAGRRGSKEGSGKFAIAWAVIPLALVVIMGF